MEGEQLKQKFTPCHFLTQPPCFCGLCLYPAFTLEEESLTKRGFLCFQFTQNWSIDNCSVDYGEDEQVQLIICTRTLNILKVEASGWVIWQQLVLNNCRIISSAIPRLKNRR